MYPEMGLGKEAPTYFGQKKNAEGRKAGRAGNPPPSKSLAPPLGMCVLYLYCIVFVFCA